MRISDWSSDVCSSDLRSVPVVVAVMLETMLLALLGGVLGGALAWIVFNGYTASTIAGGVGQPTFAFKVSPDVVWTSLKWALAIGFVGRLVPALRAATPPVTTALRAAWATAVPPRFPTPGPPRSYTPLPTTTT